MADTPSTQLLRLRREAEKRIDPTLYEKLERLEGGVGDPPDVPYRVEPDMGGQQRREPDSARPRGLRAHGLPLEIGDAANAFASEQFIAAAMHARQQRHRFPGIDRRDRGPRCVQPKIDFAARHRLQCARARHIDIADIGKTLGPQQLLCDKLRSNADDRGIGKAHVVVSSGPSAARACGAQTRPAGPASERVVRNRRRVCIAAIGTSPKFSPLTPSIRA